MKIGKTLALTLGVAAGAAITLMVNGRHGKSKRAGSFTPSLFNSKPGIRIAADMYDESEMRYI